MSASVIKTKIKARIKAQFTECNGRAFTVPSKISYLLMKSYKTPAVAIVYTGSPITHIKGSSRKIWNHTFDIFIFQTIMKEDGVTLGDAGKTGLLQLCETLMDYLDEYRFTSELPSNNIISADLMGEYGTEDYVQIGARLYSASIGFGMQYKEEE